jgi:hypothetical protein
MSSPLWTGTIVARPSSCCQNEWLPFYRINRNPRREARFGRGLSELDSRRATLDSIATRKRMVYSRRVWTQGRSRAGAD